MTPQRRKRLLLVLGIVAGVGIAAALALSAFRQNVTLYFIPSDIAAGSVKDDRAFRLGGMVAKGSVRRAPGSLDVRFTVTDFKHEVPVTYTGVLPDLFREGQGVVVHGHLAGGVFTADEVLAKHDEKYMPPKLAGMRPGADGAPGAAISAMPGAGSVGTAPATAAPAATTPATGAPQGGV